MAVEENLIRKYLAEAAAHLVAMEHKTKGPAEFYEKLEKRFQNKSKQYLSFHLSIFG